MQLIDINGSRAQIQIASVTRKRVFAAEHPAAEPSWKRQLFNTTRAVGASAALRFENREVASDWDGKCQVLKIINLCCTEVSAVGAPWENFLFVFSFALFWGSFVFSPYQ